MYNPTAWKTLTFSTKIERISYQCFCWHTQLHYSFSKIINGHTNELLSTGLLWIQSDTELCIYIIPSIIFYNSIIVNSITVKKHLPPAVADCGSLRQWHTYEERRSETSHTVELYETTGYFLFLYSQNNPIYFSGLITRDGLVVNTLDMSKRLNQLLFKKIKLEIILKRSTIQQLSQKKKKFKPQNY